MHQDLGGTDKFTGRTRFRQVIVRADQLPLGLRHLEAFVVPRHKLHLPLVEPVVEALTVERIGLCEHGVVVERVVSRREDRLHLERQPPPRARVVVDELGVVARAAVGGDMVAALP